MFWEVIGNHIQGVYKASQIFLLVELWVKPFITDFYVHVLGDKSKPYTVSPESLSDLPPGSLL